MRSLQPRWTRHVRVFGGDAAAGNYARVECFASPPPPPLLPTDRSVICQLFPTDKPHLTQLRFFGAGGAIQRCGHGALSAAHALAAENKQQHQSFEFDIGGEIWRVSHRRGNCLLLLPSVSLWEDAAAAAVADVLGNSVVRAQCTADSAGYRIVALADPAAVRALDAERIAKRPLDARAWIVSALSDRHDCEVELRYFAPQYGVQEDSGTGSIAAVVEKFWSNQRSRRLLRIFQCSAAGARWQVKPRGNGVELIGHTESVDV